MMSVDLGESECERMDIPSRSVVRSCRGMPLCLGEEAVGREGGQRTSVLAVDAMIAMRQTFV